MEPQRSPDEIVGDLVKCFLQVQEGHVHRLVLLSMLLHQQSSSMNGVSGATSLHETTLVWRDVDKASEVMVQHSLEDLRCMTQQSYWPVVCTLADIPLALPDGHGCAGCPGMGRLVLGHNSVEQVSKKGCSVVPEGLPDLDRYIVRAGCFASFHLLNGQLHLCSRDPGDWAKGGWRAWNWRVRELFIADAKEIL